jgi:catecholate siderophore receptor
MGRDSQPLLKIFERSVMARSPYIKTRPLGPLPLGAAMLAASVSTFAQTAPGNGGTLDTVTVKDKKEVQEGKDSVRAVETTIGKGKQALRDIPQSVTVVTEKLMDDRNLDTVKEALKNTAGISFLAAEGGEEDIRLRGFALQATGDLFIDGMRDPAIYDRDTFNMDRLEVLRGSASMLFGRGSTGGAVNQVTKVPRLIDQHQIDLTLGSHEHRRIEGDFNFQTGESAALRINVMHTKADNNGSGSALDKDGLGLGYRWGIGERDEFLFTYFYLNNNNGVNYGLPWIAPVAGSADRVMLPLDPKAYYGMASDYNQSGASIGTLAHTHRLDTDKEIKTQLRYATFNRDLRTSTIRLCGPNNQGVPSASCPTVTATPNLTTFGPGTIFTRGSPLKIQDLAVLQFQSDFSGKFEAAGFKHSVMAGFDAAQETKSVKGARSASQGGVNLTKPTTTAGTPDDGAWIDEGSRVLRETSSYTSTSWGVYAQDMIELAPMWKLVGGLRFDHLEGTYKQFAIPNDAAGPVTETSYRMKVSEWSKRFGVLFQPNALHSYHFSAGSSFNTSGDAYSLGAGNTETPPEQSVNLELGAKLDSADKRFTTRLALFHSTKYNERNTDPLLTVPAPTATDPNATTPLITNSGKRHVVGFELDISGKITPKWEIYGSYMWMPIAKVDKAAPCPTGPLNAQGNPPSCSQNTPGDRVGDRPALTPYHSGTFWNTYQIDGHWRVGAGLNFRGKQKPLRSEFNAKSYVTADLMAEYTWDNERYTIKADLTNVGNKLYSDQLYPGHYIPGAGRQFMLTGSLKF